MFARQQEQNMLHFFYIQRSTKLLSVILERKRKKIQCGRLREERRQKVHFYKISRLRHIYNKFKPGADGIGAVEKIQEILHISGLPKVCLKNLDGEGDTVDAERDRPRAFFNYETHYLAIR